MQFINEQYKVVKEKSFDAYGTTYIVEDIQKDDQLKHLRIINLQNETRDFIDYMKNNFYNYSKYYHPYLIDFHFFNRIRLIDYKLTVLNHYYYTYDYFEGVNLFDYCKGKDFDSILDLAAELCEAVKFLHLRGFLLCSIDSNDLQVVRDGEKGHLKILALPYPRGTGSRIIINKKNTYFAAPELNKDENYSVLTDVYIIGSVISCMLEAFNHSGEKSEANHRAVMDIIKNCMAEKPEDRFQTIDQIIASINNYFGKEYRTINKQYIQAMPQYRINPSSRHHLIDKVLNNAKEHFFINRPNKVSLVMGLEGTGKDNFLETLSIKAQHEGFITVKTVLNESDVLRFSVAETFLRGIIKYADKETIDKYIGIVNSVMSKISKFKSISPKAEDEYFEKESKEKFIQRLSSFIEEASKKFQCIFIIENFQWIDEDSLSLIDELLKSRNSSSAYIVLATDKEIYSKNIKLKEYCSKLKKMNLLNNTIVLRNFNFKETVEFIKLILSLDKVPYEFAKTIYDKTKGSPDYIYDTIYMLFSNNSIYVNDKGYWVLDNVNYELLNVSYAEDMDMLNSIYKLDSNYQDILKAVSIFDSAVSADIAEGFVGVKGERLVSQMNYLSYISIFIRKQNDWGVSYSFSSLKLKESIYKSIPKELRRKYHEKASYILKSKLSREKIEGEDELIRQMLRANWHLEVKEYISDSVRKMMENDSIYQTIQFLEHANELLSKEDVTDERILVCCILGELYERIGEYSKAVYCFNIVEDMAEREGNNYLLADVYINKYSLLYKLDDRKASLKYLAYAKNLLRTIDYKKGMYEHIIVMHRMMFHKRKYSSYIRILESALKEIDKEEYKFIYARMLGIYGRLKAYKGEYDEGLIVLEKSIQILESIGNYPKMLYPLNSIGTIYYNHYTDIQKAREYYERCLSISQRVGNVYYESISYNSIADQYRMEDKYSTALQFYQNSLKKAKQIRDKYTEFIINLNMSLTNIEIEDYKKVLLTLDDMEEEIANSRYSGDLMDYFYQCRAEFLYAMGEYERAAEYAQKSVNMCITWGITENYEAHFVKLLSEIQLSGKLNHGRIKAFLDKVFEVNWYKLGRTACVKLAEIYISKGMRKKGLELLARGLRYVSNIDTDMLRLRYEYVEALAKKGAERLEGLTKLAGLMESAENNEIKWKIYKAIAEELMEQKNYREALKYLITSLSYLRKLVYNVPDEYKIRFINSHDRNSVKENLCRAAELMTGNEPGEKAAKEYTTGNISLQEMDKYFDYTEYRDMYRYKEADETAAGEDLDTSTRMKFLGKMQELVGRFSDDETANLKHMVDLFAEITQAKNAFIATLQEDGSLNVIVSYNRYQETPFYKYLIEQAKQKRDSIIVNDTFDYNAKKGDILIPKDITAVFCIPIMIQKERDGIGIELVEERRRYKEQGDNPIIGYIYLDTDSIISNFTQESSLFCAMAAKIAYVLTDNYNMKVMSTVDKLTRLYTRKHFESALSKELAYAEKEGGQFSIIMADIDKFKSVNDRFGHQKGDEVLQSISSMIMSSVRKGDICGRYGGEEIIILLPGTDAKGAYSVAEKIRKKIENAKLLGLNTPLTISLGISSYPEHGTWAKDLIDKADQALYHVKESGRNGSRIYELNMSNSIKRIDRLAGIISGNIVEDQRKTETMLEILDLQRDSDKTLEEKLFSFLGRIIEVSEAQTGGIFCIEEAGNEKRISRKILRKRLADKEEEVYYNEGIVQKCMETGKGEYQIDWNSYPGIDILTGMPDWQSVIAVPMIDRGRIKGVTYLSVPIKSKEFDAGTYNYVKTLVDIMAAALRTELMI
ncbi:MAG TPA: diguanylate cyclase [Bacillota bacterium]|nr:diguanylate cyclase [Bacillota bacterium]